MYTVDNRKSLTSPGKGPYIIPKVTTQENRISTYNSLIDDGIIKITGKTILHGPNWDLKIWTKFIETGVR